MLIVYSSVSEVAVAFSKMSTSEDYVAVEDQGHMYVRHKDTQNRHIQIPSGHATKMATTKNYVAVGDQGHMYVLHQDTQSCNIQIPSGHHGPPASHHYFAPNLASNAYTLQAASSSIGD
jgi:hypothetical protein